MKEILVVVFLLLVTVGLTHYSGFLDGSSGRRPNGTEDPVRRRTASQEARDRVRAEEEDVQNPGAFHEDNGEDERNLAEHPAAKVAPVPAGQSFPIVGSSQEDVGRLVTDKDPGVFHLTDGEGKVQETIRQVGSTDQFVRVRDGVEVGTVTKVSSDQFNVYSKDGELIDTRQVKRP